MKTGTAILLAGAGVAVVLFIALRQKPAEEKPSGWAALIPPAIDLAKWGYGEWFADEKGGEDDA